MKRILQVVAQLKKNGTETFIMNVFRNIDREKYMFDFLTFTDSQEGFYDEIISLGSKIYSLPSRRDGFINYHRTLDKFFKSKARVYDVIHMNLGCLTSLAPLYYAKKYGIPTRIIHSHSTGCTGLHNKLFHYINKIRVSNVATHFLACSDQAREWAFRNSKAFGKCHIITNGIELNKFKFNPEIRNKVRKIFQLENSFIIGHIGTFNEIKNHSFLIDVFNELVKINPNAVLLLVGEGELFDQMKEKVSFLGLTKKIFFLGRRNDVDELLQAIDVIVMPSHFEGLPFTLIEAQAAGVPVIASSGIPSDAKASSFYHSLPLSESVHAWVKCIQSYTSFQKQEFNKDDIIHQYSVENTIQQIIVLYNGKDGNIA